MKEVTIKDRVYKMKYTLKTLFVFEELAGHPYDGKKTIETYLLCYSCLLASNPDDFDMTFDDFVDVCTDDPSIFENFVLMLQEKAQMNGQLVNDKKKEAVSL